MTNLFALISPKPDDLRACPDPVKENDHYLKAIRTETQEVIFCWGSFPMAEYRAKQVKTFFENPKCFGRNKNGSPRHPLYLAAAKTQLMDFL